MTSVSVVVPSRLEKSKRGGYFLEAAVKSIRAQTTAPSVQIQIVVGVDKGMSAPPDLSSDLGVEIAEGSGCSQAAALNAALARADGEYVAILEDDDQWRPEFLGLALAALAQAEFVSSTQLEVNEAGQVVRINDFPTPSGWIMRRETLQALRGFDESYRWHLDNEWLGRLAERGCSRIHLVEATAPVTLEDTAQVRPWLHSVLRQGGPSVRLVRHNLTVPLVQRLVHHGAGTQRIARDAAFRAESKSENARLTQRFGRVPW